MNFVVAVIGYYDVHNNDIKVDFETTFEKSKS